MFWNFTKTEVHSGQHTPFYYCPFHDAMTVITMTMTTKRAKISKDTVLQNTLKNHNF